MHTVVLVDHAFPCERTLPTKSDVSRFSGSVRICTAESLAKALQDEDAACFVTLHGPYFPKQAWSSILAFLQRGGGLVLLGGAPFKRPVDGEPGDWSDQGELTAYHQQIHIHESLRVSSESVHALSAYSELPIFSGFESLFSIEPTYGLVLNASQSADHPLESGSAGTMDTRIYPLLKGFSADGRWLSSPAVLLEHGRGGFAGGRWIFIQQTVGAAFWEGAGVELIESCAAFCSDGVTDMWIKPQYACYRPGEQPAVTLQMQKVANLGSLGSCAAMTGEPWSYRLSIWHEGGELWHGEGRIEARPYLQVHTIAIPVVIEAGCYDIACYVTAASGERRVLRQGFWGWDAELLKAGSPLATDRDYFRKDGKPFPVVGMTYMASDVARKFLFLPNVHVWDADMETMKSAGINLIRTGIWTAWRNIMLEDGHISEEVMRALDAFFLTAKRHGLEVTFTFFSFTPEAWEGVNPYLDPRSVEAQKRFVAAIVYRHCESSHVHFDLINEPSLFDPQRIFSGPRTLSDDMERAAWAKWLKARHGDESQLQNRWNMTSAELPNFAAAPLPERSEINFDVEDVTFLKRGTRWLDYALFTMEIHNRWVNELSQTIHAIHPGVLVTVGQDEAVFGTRPSPFFYAQVVDYTTVHSWWLNDHLVWDGVFAKTADKPNLIQETGIMYVETPDNRAKRSEEELRDILERKYAYAFATGGAGAVHWIWNTNCYMANVNESNIGALRADGSQKPEADVSYHFGAFMKTVGHLLEGRELEDVAVLYPYSNDFSNRRLAFDASTKAVRVLSYDLKLPVRGVSEYHLDDLVAHSPSLIIAPSPHNLSDDALQRLLAYVETGGTLLWTGPVGLDEYWRPTDRMTHLLGPHRLANVAREETLVVQGKRFPVSFSHRLIAEVNKEVALTARSGCEVRKTPVGRGKFLWCALPIELSEQSDALAAVYRYALHVARVSRKLEWAKGGEQRGLYGSKLSFAKGALFIFVSEQAYEVEVEVADADTGCAYRFTVEAQRIVMFATDQAGDVIASYREIEVRTGERTSPLLPITRRAYLFPQSDRLP